MGASNDLVSRPRFHAALGADPDWREALAECLRNLDENATGDTFGIVYATDSLVADFPLIVQGLTEATGITNWIGTVGYGVIGDETSCYDEPAIAIMTGRLTASQFALFDCVIPHNLDVSGEGTPVALVHVDPRNANVLELIHQLSEQASDAAGLYLVGAITASRHHRFDQVSGMLTDGGISGAMLIPGVVTATGLTQGCAPIGPTHVITSAQDNVIFEIDGEPALDILKADLDVSLQSDIKRLDGSVFVGFPVPRSDLADYTVHNVVRVDLDQGWLGVAAPVEHGQTMFFCRRDAAAAEADLRAMAVRVKRRAGTVHGALYISCLGRGPHNFASGDSERAILQDVLGDVPLIGLFANGEILNDRIYGYTGILALF